MGANGCNGLCEKTTVLESFEDQFLPTQALIPCQVCNVHLDEARFKLHIDHDHFCAISENHGAVVAQCLLCSHPSHSLDEQARHIANKHPYAKTNFKPQDQRAALAVQSEKAEAGDLYRIKKERVGKLVSEKEFQLLSGQGSERVQASVRGERMEGEVTVKEYRGLEFEEQLAEGELVWWKVFKGEREYHSYYLDVDPKDRTILCKAYLFARK